MKKAIASVLAVLMLTLSLSLAVSAKGNNNMVGMPNPFTEVKTMKEAKAITGFSMTVPKKAAGAKKVFINCTDSMIQVGYKSSLREVRIRKAKGFVPDLDGDYNDYPKNRVITVEKKLIFTSSAVLTKADGDYEMYYVAKWYSKGFTFSVTCENGMTKAQLVKIIKAVK